MVVVYERNISFSLARGLVCTLVPFAGALACFALYWATVADFSPADAFRAAWLQLRGWYRAYPQYLLSGHLLVFLASMGYRRRLVNWWSQLVVIAGLGLFALVLYSGNHADSARSFLSPPEQANSFGGAPGDKVALPVPPSRPNLLTGSSAPALLRTTISPTASGEHLVNLLMAGTSLVFVVAPDAQETVVPASAIPNFDASLCAPLPLSRATALTATCRLNIDELRLSTGQALRRVDVLVTTSDGARAILGSDLLTAFGYRRTGEIVTLGR